MQRPLPLILLGLVGAGVLLASWWLHAWGGVALVAVAGLGIAWYRMQVARSAEAEKFFGDPGEETRLTGFQAGTPSEMDRGPGEPPSGP
ncbi:hypothetical protein HHL11_09145 [Ramlibacter sp. G-1-2-2]|uniref:Uncharacterized protein n=1 Tax=Ramlibacter agri TaxID=2728837 RepID=A0A848H5Q9_9BURK|nr:hypothetical protein [Ramlibacter agri]NML43913.1 hypothetical protein [Ramlibacter agri]